MGSTIRKPNMPGYQDGLIRLQMKEGWLVEIGGRILTAYTQATPHDALNAAGSFAYFEAVRCMRDIFCPKGWKIESENGLEAIALPDIKVRIIVSSGDQYTGNSDVAPSTKNSKGPQTKKIVNLNAKLRWLFPEMDKPIEQDSGDNATWIFLYHVDMKKNEMRIELSLPVGFDINKEIVQEWKERILLPSIDFDSSANEIIENEFTPEVEFEIKRKAND